MKRMIAPGALAALTLAGAAAGTARAELVEYRFEVRYAEVNYSGRPAQAMTIEGQIPAPTIEAHVGDTLRVVLVNKMDTETSVHWHGVLLPNDQDGVPYLNTPPIAAGASFAYQFPVTHTGTYWYHSHSGLQEQRGLYGALIFRPPRGQSMRQAAASDREHTVLFSDWTDELPEQVFANLKKDDDYYALKKGSVQSWTAALRQGAQALKNKYRQSWERMGPMDLSDVGYDAFLVNGKRRLRLPAEPGEKVLLRMINGAAASYFHLEYAGGPMTVVAADGVAVEPVRVRKLRMAIAETYDVVVEVPPDGRAYELRATSIDGTGYSSALLGTGPETAAAPDMPPPDLFARHDHGGHGGHDGGHEGHAMHEMHEMHGAGHGAQEDGHGHAGRHAGAAGAGSGAGQAIEYLQDYGALKATASTALPADAPWRKLTFRLTGSMERYTWSFDDTILAHADKVRIRHGENVRFTMVNETMMNHPIHLHGHFFRVLNGQGDYSPLKHTVNVPPLQTVAIEFAATEDQDWFFHCHILYHMKAGMARVISYGDTGPEKTAPAEAEPRETAPGETVPGETAPEPRAAAPGGDSPAAAGGAGMPALPPRALALAATGDAYAEPQTPPRKQPPLGRDQWYLAGTAGLLSNMLLGKAKAATAANSIESEFHYDYRDDYEAHLIYERRFSRFLGGYAGVNLKEEHDEERETRAITGIHYTLPLLIESDLRLYSDGETEIGLSSELQLARRLGLHWKYRTDGEYLLLLTHEVSKRFLLAAIYDNDFRGGVGILLRN